MSREDTGGQEWGHPARSPASVANTGLSTPQPRNTGPDQFAQVTCESPGVSPVSRAMPPLLVKTLLVLVYTTQGPVLGSGPLPPCI